ncbi:MAG TPA: SLC13 family permease [Geminicoccus sp.]|nr:SLC13 family permease [Geminicoccus sp.]HEX2528972.1 SLC13 family permease [Geminicoccus sp.]
MNFDAYLILVAALGIAVLLYLIIKVRLHAFVALLLVSLLVAVAAGMPLPDIIKAFERGMGSTLGFVAIVVGLGAMFGQMLEVSGGAQRLATTLVAKFGQDRVPWALGLTGFLVSIPVFFDVALVILVSVIYELTRNGKRPILYYGVPLIAGGAATHAFIPPTPGPIAVANLLNADLGLVILFGTICALPAMAIAGPLWGSIISRRITRGLPDWLDGHRDRGRQHDRQPRQRQRLLGGHPILRPDREGGAPVLDGRDHARVRGRPRHGPDPGRALHLSALLSPAGAMAAVPA